MYKFALFAKVIFMGGVYKGELHVYPKDWNKLLPGTGEGYQRSNIVCGP
jgi:hypothetical protein